MGVIERARELRPIIEQAAISLPDDAAARAVELFGKWVVMEPDSIPARLGGGVT